MQTRGPFRVAWLIKSEMIGIVSTTATDPALVAPLILAEFRDLADAGKELKATPPENYNAAYQSYHDQVNTSFRRLEPILVGAAAAAAVTPVAATLPATGTFWPVPVLVGAIAGTTAAMTARSLLRKVEDSLKTSLEFTCSTDSLALNVDSFRSTADPIFASKPHKETSTTDSLEYSDVEKLKEFITRIVGRAATISGLSENETKYQFAGVVRDALKTLDLSNTRQVNRNVRLENIVEVRRLASGHPEINLAIFDIKYNGEVSKSCCQKKGTMNITVNIKAWKFYSAMAMKEAAEKALQSEGDRQEEVDGEPMQ